MLKSLHIKGFQKHKSLKIRFDPLVTTIIGPSDVGKSAILRALGWVVFNRPSGSAFIRTGSKRASVTLKTDQHRIKRAKGKTNTYHLDGAKFTAFGTGVPEEISSTLNLNELNFQKQIGEEGFWFSLSPGEVSRRLNQIVDLEVVDSTLANIASVIRKVKAKEGVIQERLAAAREERSKLKHITEADADLNAVEILHCVWEAVREEATFLQGHVENITKYQHEFDTASAHSSEIQSELVELDKQAAKLREFSGLMSRLHVLIGDHKEHSHTIEHSRKQLKRIAKEIESEMGDVCPLCQQQI